MTGRPYLSIVAAARNDDHGGNLLRRLQIFVHALAAQAKRVALPMELVLVEWNPPADRPPLAQAIPWPASDAMRIRIITAPRAVHGRFHHSAALPLYQMIAKNAGIRRAGGEFVLATNVDLLFSTELWEYLAERRLECGRMYRLDRYDADAGVPIDGSTEDQLAYCRSHLLRRHSRGGTFLLNPDGSGATAASRPPSRLALGWRVAREWVAGTGKLPPLAALLGIRPTPPPRFADLHTNACGDFTLAHRRHWLELRGYPEFDMYSMNLDSVFCFAAHYGGAREAVLGDPLRIYHIEHRSGWTPEGERQLYERLRAAGIPWLEWEQVKQWAAEMDRVQAPMLFNGEDWGMGGVELGEEEVCG